MIPKINNILYTTDLSKNSAYAFRYAVNSAEHHEAKIHILHVLETEQAKPSPFWVDLLPQFPQTDLDEAYSKKKNAVREERAMVQELNETRLLLEPICETPKHD